MLKFFGVSIETRFMLDLDRFWYMLWIKELSAIRMNQVF